MTPLKKIRVLFVLQPYHFGGRRTFAWKFLNQCNRERFHVLIFTPESGELQELFSARGAEVHCYRSLFKSSDRNLLAKKLIGHNVDLAITIGYDFGLALAARTAGVPHVFQLGAVLQEGVRSFQPDQEQAILAGLDLLAKRRICVSKFVSGPLKRNGLEYEVIYNGVELPTFSSPHDLGKIAMIAHFLPQKRHEDFLMAFSRVRKVLPETKAVIYGEIYPWPEAQEYFGWIQRRTRQLDLQDHLEFSTFSSARELDTIPLRCLVMPSENEGLSNACLEAMARSTPVIGSASGGIPELIDHGIDGLLFPCGDVEAMVESILKVLCQPEYARELALAARHKVETSFRVEDMISRYQAVFEELIDLKCEGMRGREKNLQP